jgi:hypothetical protein
VRCSEESCGTRCRAEETRRKRGSAVRRPLPQVRRGLCVFDIDAHPNLLEAKQQAEDNGLKLAVSNPCFELWILLHFQDQRAHQERGWIQAACREHLPDFVKEVPYDRVQPTYAEAVARAKALDKWQAEQNRPGGNPCTAVHELTERIEELGKDPFLSQKRA